MAPSPVPPGPAVEVVEVADDDAGGHQLIRDLFREYQRELGVDLCFQRFGEELETLPGHYRAPLGTVMLACLGSETIGCVALRPLAGPSATECEMKRLYLRPHYRGATTGRLLARAIVQKARRCGYQLMRLDTLRRLVPALELYRSMGFVETAPYCDNPEEDVVYMALDLSRL